MKRKTICLVVSCLFMVAALLLASCAPAVTEEEQVVPPEEEVVTEEEVAPSPTPTPPTSTPAPSEVTLFVTYRISASSSGSYERTFKRADITDEEIHEIAWDFIVVIAEEKGIDPNSIAYDVKIDRFHTTPEPTGDARDYHVPFSPGPEPDPPRIPSYSDQFPPGHEPPRIPSYSDQFPPGH